MQELSESLVGEGRGATAAIPATSADRVGWKQFESSMSVAANIVEDVFMVVVDVYDENPSVTVVVTVTVTVTVTAVSSIVGLCCYNSKDGVG